MGQSDSKVKTSKMQTVAVKKHKKNSSREKSVIATVSFGVGSPLNVNSTEFLNETVWQEVFDTEAVNYCAVGSRDSAILLSDDRKPTDTGLIQEPVICKEVPSNKEANSSHSVPNSTLIDPREIQSDPQTGNTSIAVTQPSTNQFLFSQERNNTIDKVRSPPKVLEINDDSRALPGTIHSHNTSASSQDPTLSLNQETTNLGTSTQTETATIANSSTVLLNKESVDTDRNQVSNHSTTVIPCSRSCADFVTDFKRKSPMLHSESMHLIRERAGSQKRSILSHLPKMKPGKPSLGRNVRFEELAEETAMSASMNDLR